MEIKYIQALKAGAIGGIVIALIMILFSLLNLAATWLSKNNGSIYGLYSTASVLCQLLIFLLYVVVLAGVGVLAVRWTRAVLKDITDGILVSALAGLVAGIIWGVVNLVVSLVMVLLTPLLLAPSYSGADYGQYWVILGGIAAMGGVTNLCCCAPTYIVMSAVIAGISGAIYMALTQEKAPVAPV